MRMRLICAASVALMAFASGEGAWAGPGAATHWVGRHLAATGRVYERTAVNMVTFRDKRLAVEEWAIVGAALADTVQTQRAEAACPTCTEGNWAFGRHPGTARLWSESMGLTAFEVAVQQYCFEPAPDKLPTPLEALLPGLSVPAHIYGAVHNESIIHPELH